MDGLRIGVLGPLEVVRSGRPVGLGGRNEQIVLAALVVHLNRAVSTDTLADAVWNGAPPPSGLDTLQSILSRLRSRLGHDAIELVDHSYRFVAAPDHVDAIRFERLLGEAAMCRADDPSAASSLATEALALWRGTPFGNLGDAELLVPEVRRLESLRSSAVEVRLDADVACGHLVSAIADLRAEIIEHPYRERLWYLLALALARDGCRVDALRTCHRLRVDLREVGLEPTADICELEQMIIDEAPEVRSRLHR